MARKTLSSLRPAWIYGIVVLLLIISWLVANGALQNVRATLHTVVVEDDGVRAQVDAITAAMVDQETGMRGYLLTDDPTFLTPYNSGRRVLPSAFQSASRHVDDPFELRLLREMQHDAHVWQVWAHQELRRYALGGHVLARNAAVELAGNRSFNRFRSVDQQLQTQLQADHRRLLHNSETTFTLAEIMLGSIRIGVIGIVLILGRRSVRYLRGERRARQDAERLSAIVESSEDAIIGMTLDGIITSWNDGAQRLYGHTAASMIGQNFDRVIPSDLRHDFSRIWASVRRGERVRQIEAVHVRHDDSLLDVSITFWSIRDGDGAATGVAATVRDIGERKRAQDALQRREEQYRSVVETSLDGILVADIRGVIVFANPQMARVLGYQSFGDLLNRSTLEIIAPEDRPAARAAMPDLLRGQIAHVELHLLRADGSSFLAEVNASFMGDPREKRGTITAAIKDISERRAQEEALQESEARHRQMFEHTQAIKWLIDPTSGIIVDANPAACAFYGYSRDELCGKHISVINMLPPEELTKEIARATHQRASFVFKHRLASGELRDVEVHSSPVEVQGRTLLYSVIHDITDRVRAQEVMRHQALHDSLTGLPNRTLLLDRLEHAIHQAHRGQAPLALLLTDLDRFKEINDTFGHHVGDLLLQEVAIRIQRILRETDTAARLGGDEFAVVLPATDERGAGLAAARILTALSQAIVVEDKTFHIGTSVGIACYGPHGVDATTLLRAADVAMYAAKRRGDDYAVYIPDEDDNSAGRLTLISDLRRAIEQDELVLHYQPKLDLKTGEVTSVEALVRWQHPEQGFIPPDEFVPLAEHTGLIKPMTRWVLNEALRQCRDWHASGFPIDVAVNLSAWSLHDPELVETIDFLLGQWNVLPSSLGLELTESVVMTDPVRAKDTLTQLHSLGVQLSIDDFGTGYSSLGYLKRLPVQQLKIDRSFVMQMASNDDDAFIARAIVDLSHNLGLEVVAEGVEERQTLRLLAMMGCDLAQGYHLSRPLNAPDLLVWLQQSKSEIAT